MDLLLVDEDLNSESSNSVNEKEEKGGESEKSSINAGEDREENVASASTSSASTTTNDLFLLNEFGNVGEKLFEYSCALETSPLSGFNILIHGTMFLCTNYLCFYSNLFQGKKIRIAYSNINEITKENTALVIPNAISIITYRKEYIFRTFFDREITYAMITKILFKCRDEAFTQLAWSGWKIGKEEEDEEENWGSTASLTATRLSSSSVFSRSKSSNDDDNEERKDNYDNNNNINESNVEYEPKLSSSSLDSLHQQFLHSVSSFFNNKTTTTTTTAATLSSNDTNDDGAGDDGAGDDAEVGLALSSDSYEYDENADNISLEESVNSTTSSMEEERIRKQSNLMGDDIEPCVLMPVRRKKIQKKKNNKL